MRSDGAISVAVAVGPTGHSGIGRYNRELVLALADRADVALTLVGGRDEVDEMCSTLGRSLPSVGARGGRLVGQLRMLFAGRALLRRGVDVVHGTRHVLPLRWRGASVLTFHDDYALTRVAEYDRVKRWTLPVIFKQALRKADVIVTLSPEMSDVARRWVSSSTVVIDAGAAASSELTGATPAQPPQTAGIDRFALVVGDAGPRKRVGELLDAWRSIDGVTLIVAGGRAASGDLRERLRSEPDVLLLEGPSDAELAWLYLHTELVIDAADAEGFGFARVEAASFGAKLLTLRGSASDAEPWERTVGGALLPDRGGDDRPVRRDVAADWATVADRTVAAYRSAMLVCSARSARLRR